MTDTDEVLVGVVVEDQAVTVADGPVPTVAGTFALYEMPDGGLMLATDIAGRGLEQRVIPGKVLRLVTSGPMSKMFGSIFGGGGE